MWIRERNSPGIKEIGPDKKIDLRGGTKDLRPTRFEFVFHPLFNASFYPLNGRILFKPMTLTQGNKQRE
jgi:hypothetical protein